MTFAKIAKLFVLICAAALPQLVQAELRIVTVDVNRLLNESKEAAEKRKTLDEIQLKARKKLDEKKAALQALDKKIKEANLSEDSKEVERFKSEAREYERTARESQEDLKREFLKLNRSVTEKALKVIQGYAERNKIDLVLDKSEKSRGPVLYGQTQADVTDQILKELNG